MLRIQQRIEKVERLMGRSHKMPIPELFLKFVDAAGNVTRITEIKDGRIEWGKPLAGDENTEAPA